MRSLLCLAALIAAPALTWGAILKPIALPDLVERAEHIVFAEVKATQSEWWGGRIITRADLETLEALKGGEGPLQVETLGGQINGLAQRVSGMPKLEVGERVVLFLDRAQARPALRVVGLKQGLFKVNVDLRGLEVVRELHGLQFVEPRDEAEDQQPLVDFLARVSALTHAAPVVAPPVEAPATIGSP